MAHKDDHTKYKLQKNGATDSHLQKVCLTCDLAQGALTCGQPSDVLSATLLLRLVIAQVCTVLTI